MTSFRRHTLTLAGVITFSLPALAEVTLVPGGEKTTWKYLDTGTAPGDTWTTPQFDDSQWKAGPAPLGYGQPRLNTQISFGPNPDAKHLTAYFRTTFHVDAKDKLEKLALHLRRDDGAIVYLNGREAARSNLRPGPLDASTLSEIQVGSTTQEQYHLFVVPASLLSKDGANTIAVEVHQGDPGSSDLSLDLKIVGYAPGEVPPDALAPANAGRDFYRDGMMAAQRGEYEEAAKLLAQLDPAHPQYARTMALLAHRIYGEALNRGKDGLPFAQKAYDLAPTDRDVVRAYIKTHVLAGVLFDPKDLARERKKTVAPEHAFLVTKPKFEDTSRKLPRAQLEADLDLLEHLLTKCFAYLELRPVDYRAALDAIRQSLDDETTVNRFGLSLAKLISLFCDGHAAVRPGGLSSFYPSGYAPFVAGSHQGRIFLANAEGKAFLDPKHPYVASIDGKPIADWMKAAGYPVTKESPQWHLRGSLEMLSYLNYVRAELGLPLAGTLTLKLESEDRKDSTELKLPVASRPSRRFTFPRGESRRIDAFGYLRIPQMTSSTRLETDFDEWMTKFRDTKGLIIDLRGNTGGTKDILHTLFPYFMKPGDPMRIVELSTYRKPMELPKPMPEGFMMSAMSAQVVTSSHWKSDAERQLVAGFIKNFRPEWKLPAGKFSDWHALGLDSKVNPRAYHYDKPLIILQDSSSFSASDIFLGAFEDHPNTTQMGTPSGGGNGWMETYTLPNSRLRITLCQSAKFRPNGKLYDGVGIAPDVLLEPTPQDYFGETDTLLDAAVKRLKENTAAKK